MSAYLFLVIDYLVVYKGTFLTVETPVPKGLILQAFHNKIARRFLSAQRALSAIQTAFYR